MPSSRKHTSTSKQLEQSTFLRLIDSLGSDSDFCTAVQSVDDINRPRFLNQTIHTQAASVGFIIYHPNPLQYVQSRLSSYDPTLLSSTATYLQKLFQIHTTTIRSQRRRRQHIASRFLGVGLPNLPVHRLHRLLSEYPPRDCIILERHDLPTPPLPKLVDRTCHYTTKYHKLDVNLLSYQLQSNESGIFLDADTDEPIAIVIRDFAKDYFNLIQDWGVNLIKDTINRRSLSQRNNPGQLARVGIGEGQRNARMFGWVRNLKKRYRNASDQDEHEQNISSLFELFYALLHKQVPWIVEKFEKVMLESGMPRLDKNNMQQFSLPFTDHPVIFEGHPLTPPEGYMAINFMKDIHRDRHWDRCPWGVYWTLLRHQMQGLVGTESGASFFMSDYGLRIINASNSCVIFDVSRWHGTGNYYNGVNHMTITLLLSKITQTTWKQYQEKVLRGELNDGNLFWYPETEASS